MHGPHETMGPIVARIAILTTSLSDIVFSLESNRVSFAPCRSAPSASSLGSAIDTKENHIYSISLVAVAVFVAGRREIAKF